MKPIDQSIADTDTAHSLLPIELLFGICSLCEITPHLPAAFRTASSKLFKAGSQPHRVWTHRFIFFNPVHDPDVAHLSNTVAHRLRRFNNNHPSTAQIESHFSICLSTHLKSFLSSRDQYSVGIAPPVTQTHEGLTGSAMISTGFVVTSAVIEWLFSMSGPFRQQVQRSGDEWDWAAELQTLRHRYFPRWWEASDETHNSLPKNWSLLPDSILLAVYSIRSSQVGLLETTLKCIRSIMPNTFASTCAPLWSWSHLLLHDHDTLHYYLVDAIQSDSDPDPPMSFPAFLVLAAAIDWSPAALQVVSRTFAECVDMGAIAAQISSNDVMSDVLTVKLTDLNPSESDRILGVLNWFRQHNAPIHSAQLGCIAKLFTSASYFTFQDFFGVHVVPSLPTLEPSTASLPYSLGSLVAGWVCKGHADFLDVALEHDLLDVGQKGKVLRYAISAGDEAVEAAIVGKCSGSDADLSTLIFSAICDNSEHVLSDDWQSTSDDVLLCSRLLNILVTHASKFTDPNRVLKDVFFSLSIDTLSTLLFDCPLRGDLLFQWDYPGILLCSINGLAARLAKKDGEDEWDIAWREQQLAYFARRLIDRVAQARLDWRTLGLNQVATVCAMRLIALECEHTWNEAANSSDPLSHEAVQVVRIVVAAALDKMQLVGSFGVGSSIKSFTSLVPSASRIKLGAMVQAVASLEFTDWPKERIPDPHQTFNLFFDSLLLLDHNFVVSHIPFSHPASVRVWPKLDLQEFARLLPAHRAIGLVRVAVAAKNIGAVAQVVKNLSSAIRNTDKFAMGLCAIMRRWPECKSEFVSGLDQCEWVGWREHLARYLPLPKDSGEEDSCESLVGIQPFGILV